MKNAFFVLLFSLFLTPSTVVKGGSGNSKPPVYELATGKSAEFAGSWKGTEQCQSVSAPVAIVIITADGPTQVFLTGMYSIQGKIRGIVKGNTIVIPRQAIIDPNFKNLAIEGSLTMGANKSILTGVVTVLNNEQRDGCTVNYRR